MIHYGVGDATEPIGRGIKVIAHICNDRGAWGAGFVLALSNKYPQAEEAYRDMEEYELGIIQLVKVDTDVCVCNMIAQKGTISVDNPHPIQYDALATCFEKLFTLLTNGTSLHMPRIGCGLAGGKWEKVEEVIEVAHWAKPEVEIFVYDLK